MVAKTDGGGRAVIISKTPFRISFFGGGTDYPGWLKSHEGAVLSTTIDKYCYISSRYLPPFFDYKTRLVYSSIEFVKSTNEIKHPSARECLNFMKVDKGVEIHHDADLPARTGLGSSSSFTAGLLNCLYALKGQIVSKEQLAKDAISVEQDWIKENVGCQDQIAAAYGGFNLVEFKPEQNFRISPVILQQERLEEFQSHLLLVFTGFSRIASEIAEKLVKTADQKQKELEAMRQMVYEGLRILSGKNDLGDFGKLLNESWKIKRGLADNITTSQIDQIYDRAMKAGALGGKLLGAGGGGFLLLFVRPEHQPKVKSALTEFLHVPFKFEYSGSQIIFYKPDL